MKLYDDPYGLPTLQDLHGGGHLRPDPKHADSDDSAQSDVSTQSTDSTPGQRPWSTHKGSFQKNQKAFRVLSEIRTLVKIWLEIGNVLYMGPHFNEILLEIQIWILAF